MINASYASFALVLALAACSSNPPPAAAPAPAVDSAATRARADSLAAAARRDSLAAAVAAVRADSAARARTDSLSRAAAARSRADSVRAQVLRDSAEAAARLPSGLDPASDSAFALPIHFDYDRADIKPEDQAALDRKIAILRANPRLETQIEGHCDERGPDEYNLALGERRAAAVKRYLVEHGITASRITIISYGEERPADPGHTEDAWAKNRRAEFRVTRSAR